MAKKTFNGDKLEYLRIYLGRLFAVCSKAKIEMANEWLAGEEEGTARYESARQEFLQATDSAALHQWADRRMNDVLSRRFETSYRQAVFIRKQEMVTFRIRKEIHDKLAEYCKTEGLQLSDGIDKLLVIARRPK